MKPIKLGYKLRILCASSSSYLSKFDLYVGWKKDFEVNLGKSVFKQLSGKLKGIY